MDKLTRRQLAVIATLATTVVVAQTPPAPGTDLDKAARESHLQNSAVLARFAVPMSLEPAFEFKA
jgi:hypothetical protein